jgi:hypothetical protein
MPTLRHHDLAAIAANLQSAWGRIPPAVSAAGYSFRELVGHV